MSEIKIRAVVSTDLPSLIKMDHRCMSDYVWQMDTKVGEAQVGATFREIRLPRTVAVNYPRQSEKLMEEWSRRSSMLVAIAGESIAGYIKLTDKLASQVNWITDLVVATTLRRKGIGTALLMAATGWALERGCRQSIIEVSSKNIAGIRFAQKHGYEFCGYNDHYYLSQDVALFFGRSMKSN